MRRVVLTVFAVTLVAGPAAAEKPMVNDSLTRIKQVGREGQGNEDAAKAWKTLTAAGGTALVPTLEAFDGANPTAANWLRSAIDAIVEGEAKAKRQLPVEELTKFLKTTTHTPAARRIAFEVLEKADKPTAEKVILGMTDDPSVELRRDAIAKSLPLLPKDDEKGRERLFAAARDKDQVEAIGKELKKTPDDITAHFNFITKWHVVGPFDNAKNAGLTTAYPPEKGVDLTATYDGKGGAKAGWKAVTAKGKDGEYAQVDLNAELAKHKDAVAYAYAVIELPKETPAELRAGSITSLKIFVNGKDVFERDEYHHGMSMDQHVGKTTLKAGKNEILVKVCQNDQKEQWAQTWLFQLRVCDSTGGAIPFQQVSPEGK